MAFLKFAKAVVAKTEVNTEEWSGIKSPQGLDKTASASILKEYSPSQYLLSHATIIASVDTEEVPNVELGKVASKDGGVIDRVYNDYYITPETSRYSNSNNDSWERELLLGSYKTFVGAQNYLEHVQIPELSKGRIIDAVARDLGDTVYVDILVATDRKHESLIADIKSGKMNSLSMGCSITFSQCSKCGNVATDDTNMCRHIKYEKGNTFIDESGKTRVVSELCGHKSVPDSVTFIEASWVENPAFKGAVVRNLVGDLVDASDEAALEDQIRQAFQLPKAMTLDSFLKAASIQKTSFGFGGDDEEETPKEEKGFFDDIKDEVMTTVRDIVKKEIKKEIKKESPVDLSKADPSPDLNDNLINSSVHESYLSFSGRYASKFPTEDKVKATFNVLHVAKHQGWDRVSSIKGVKNSDIVSALYIQDHDYLKKVSKDLFHCLLKVGSANNHLDNKVFLKSCIKTLGRKISKEEATYLLNKSKHLI